MTLLRMLAFRPDGAGAAAPGVNPAAAGGTIAPPTLGAPAAAAPAAVDRAAPAAATATIDAGSWPAVVDAATLSGMVRQFALNCLPSSFENDVLTLRLDQAVADRRARPIEEKLVQGLGKYLGRDIRVVFEVSTATLASPARQRAMAEQDKVLRALSAFEDDPAVKGLKERFGAEVDAASVKPAN
jgi:DNA polymerase-3 subunit gamma/tau